MEKQWSFADELFESRCWAPRRSNLGHQWKSITSEKWVEIQQLVGSAASAPDRPLANQVLYAK